MADPNPRADEGAPVDREESFDEADEVAGELDTEQIVRVPEMKIEHDEPHENTLNDPDRGAAGDQVEAF